MSFQLIILYAISEHLSTKGLKHKFGTLQLQHAPIMTFSQRFGNQILTRELTLKHETLNSTAEFFQ